MRIVVIAAVLVVAQSARADHCAKGVGALAEHDLPHAALYLEDCDDAEPKAMRELHKQLEASDLSVLDIVSEPAGLDAEIDTLPGEHLTTPVTVYVPAGHHEVRAGGFTNTVDTKPHTRAVVVIDARTHAPPPPKAGTADFRDEAPEADQPTGPPPAVKHRPMMPCKFSNSCTEAGEQIEDPLAREVERIHEYPLASAALRAGAEYTTSLEPTLGVGVTWRLPWQDDASTRPWLLVERAMWTRREMSSAFEATTAVAKVVAAPDTAWLLAGVGGNFDSYYGPGAAGLVEIALRKLPVVIGAQYTQQFDAWHDRAVTIELGVGLRRY